MPKICEDYKKRMVELFSKSNCVKKEGYTLSECINDPSLPGVDGECIQAMKMFLDCRRSMVQFNSRTPITWAADDF